MHGSGLDLALVFLLAAVIAVPVFKRFGLGAVLGYLAAGVVLGPYGIGVVGNAAPVLAAAEIGVVMLLFVIGLELSPARLRVMRRPVFGVGGLQVALSGLALGALALGFGLDWRAALVVGFGLALSSTAVGLQLLAERKALTSDYGRLAFAILLFQDLAAIPLLAVIPLLGHGAADAAAQPTWWAVLKAVAAIAALVLGGRVLLRHVFGIVARTRMPEVFTATALLVVLGSAWLMQLAGLSMGLGAFLAGALLADSEFRHELEAQIQPFEGLLLGLFFMAVGMSIDLSRVLAEPLLILACVAGLLLVKFAILFALGLRPGRLDMREALLLGSVLALGGEFAFVVFGEAQKAGLLSPELRGRLVAIVGLSMAVTPLLLIAMTRLLPDTGRRKPARPFDAIRDEHPQVLIAGFGRFGQIVARLLAAQGTRFVAIEHSPEQVDFMRRFGNPIHYGDPAQAGLLQAAGGSHVRVFVVAIDDVQSNLDTVRVIRRLYPQAQVFARARNRRHAWELMDLGAQAVRETFHSSLKLGERVLVALGASDAVAADRAERFREHDEKLLVAQHLIHDDEAALIQTSQEARRELEQLFAADRGEGTLGSMLERKDPDPAKPQGS
ncbi:monovalent cation:proton antiporter-2 (CPA2) family protein [Cognatiluteimonas weifangensis]|uniref:Glutathione-regulated potassium-efflux system protein KefB n=1 Tax=Cognatiluteimonas weifangensis TaxID=2303539 RepID=A0A372DHC6_9GAMM|nr:monovalent cation:proton antiporter-2 (CPA2) family protein [Luteimonas weifangensis]RFP58236.1 glutathione-regulated potassium-efflux system protein KefB [Luteimonas weifangensis]